MNKPDSYYFCVSAMADRRTMADRHMRRSACWKAGESEVICLHGGLRLCRPYIGRKAKNFRPVFGKGLFNGPFLLFIPGK